MLGELGQLIFLDRYAQKDHNREHLEAGQRVVVCPDTRVTRRFLATLTAVDPVAQSTEVVLEQTGERLTLPWDQVDLPIEDFEQACLRVPKAVASVEEDPAKWAEAFEAPMKSGRWVPAGRIWAGAGVVEFLTPYNCFVLPAPHDSRSGIIEGLNQLTEIMSRGGGVGLPLMSLRPKYSFVKGVNGRSSGSVCWSELYAFATKLIEQGGSRQGALMLMHYDWHPDVLDFIDAKRDGTRLTGANLSVAVSDELMEAAQRNETWDLIFPETDHPAYDTEWDGDIRVWKDKGYPVRVFRTLKARELWQRIVEAAHASAEPGLFFVGRYNRMSNSFYYEKGRIYCSNPCQPGFASVLTPDGIRTMDDVKIGDTVWSGSEWTQVVNKMMTGIKPVYAYQTRAGTFYGTENHRVLSDGEKIEVMDVEAIDVSVGPEANDSEVEPQDVLDGLVLGDGTYISSKKINALIVGDKDGCYESSSFKSLLVEPLPPGYSLGKSLEYWQVQTTLQDPLPKTYERRIPDRFVFGSPLKVRGFLRGLYAANGSVISTQRGGRLNGRIALKASSFPVIDAVQLMLSSLGIPSYYTVNKPAEVEFSNGTYLCRESYDLNISTPLGRDRFNRLIGFVHPHKQAALEALLQQVPSVKAHKKSKATFEIISREFLGELPVYAITVEAAEHTYWTGGLYVANCGEQGIPAWSVCNLGHVNLAQHLRGSGTRDPAEMRWDVLEQTVRLGVRFLDDVIDIARVPFARQEEQQRLERRIGLGTMGLGEALIRMHIRYGDNQTCLDFLDKLYGFICTTAYDESVNLAIEKGAFPACVQAQLVESGFIRTLPSALRERIRANGLRNVCILSQAPTGTVGTMMGTSTGIEPYPWLEWEREGRLGKHREQAAPLRDWLAAGNTIIDTPPWFTSAMDMTPDDHAVTQAAIQRWVDSSISKTSNLPSTYTVQQVDQFYRKMYELGCKGGTVYRDLSRDAQVLRKIEDTSTPEERAWLEVHPVPKDAYPMKAVAIQTSVGKLSVKLGYDPETGEPFEAWLDVSRSGTIMAADREAIARLISLLLRMDSHVTPTRRVQLVIDQLAGIQGGDPSGFGPEKVFSIPDAVAKALGRLLDASRDASEEAPAPSLRPPDICPECHSASLYRADGCEKCMSCAFSRC